MLSILDFLIQYNTILQYKIYYTIATLERASFIYVGRFISEQQRQEDGGNSDYYFYFYSQWCTSLLYVLQSLSRHWSLFNWMLFRDCCHYLFQFLQSRRWTQFTSFRSSSSSSQFESAIIFFCPRPLCREALIIIQVVEFSTNSSSSAANDEGKACLQSRQLGPSRGGIAMCRSQQQQ